MQEYKRGFPFPVQPILKCRSLGYSKFKLLCRKITEKTLRGIKGEGTKTFAYTLCLSLLLPSSEAERVPSQGVEEARKICAANNDFVCVLVGI